MVQHKRWSTSLEVSGHRFKCVGKPGEGPVRSGCGARDARLQAEMPVPEMPKQRPVPAWVADGKAAAGCRVVPDAPLGVDAEAWAKADDRERKRLVRIVRG